MKLLIYDKYLKYKLNKLNSIFLLSINYNLVIEFSLLLIKYFMFFIFIKLRKY